MIAEIQAANAQVERDRGSRVRVLELLEITLRKRTFADERCRAARIDVRDIALRRERLAAFGPHAHDPIPLDDDLLDLRLEHQSAARPCRDLVRDAADEVLVVLLGIVSASIVAPHQRDMEEQRNLIWRQQIVASLACQHRLQAGRHAEGVIELLKRGALIAKQVRKADRGTQEVTPAGGLGQDIELAAECHDGLEVPADRQRVVREAMDQSIAILLEPVRDPIAISRHHDVIEPLGIEPTKSHLFVKAEPAQELVDRFAFATIEDVVNLGAESILAHSKGMCVPTGRVVRLEHEHTSPLGREQGTRRQAGHAGADHEVIEGLIIQWLRACVTRDSGGRARHL